LQPIAFTVASGKTTCRCRLATNLVAADKVPLSPEMRQNPGAGSLEN